VLMDDLWVWTAAVAMACEMEQTQAVLMVEMMAASWV